MTEFTTWRSLVDGAEIVAIPDTVVAQYVADEQASTSTWEDQIGSADLTGSATEVVSDAINGFDALRFQPSNSDEMDTDGFTVSERHAIAVVYEQQSSLDSGGHYFDAGPNADRHDVQDDSGGQYRGSRGASAQDFAANTTDPVLILWDCKSGDDDWYVNDSVEFSEDTGSNPLDGLTVANRRDLDPSDFGMEADYAEVVIYDDPSDGDISNEIDRLTSKYDLV